MRSSHSSSVAVGPVSLDGVGVHFPNRIEHGMIVRIEDVLLEFGMARDVDLPDAIMRDVVQVIVGD